MGRAREARSVGLRQAEPGCNISANSKSRAEIIVLIF